MTDYLILDPGDESVPVTRALAQRGAALTGRLALLDIIKPRGNVLLDRLETQLKARAPGIEVKRYSKPTFTKPAPAELRAEIRAANDLVVEALAD